MQTTQPNPYHTLEGVFRLHMQIQGFETVRELYLAMKAKLADSCIKERTLYSAMAGKEMSLPVLRQLAAYLHNDKMPVDYTLLVGLNSANRSISKKSRNQLKGALIYMAMA